MVNGAHACFHAGDLAGAIEAARGLVAAAKPPSPSAAGRPAWAEALVAVADGQWGPGLAAAERALAEDPADALARWCRGEARIGLGDRAGALADWSWIVEADPASRTAWKDRALARALLGDRAGALEDLGRLAALAPDDVVPRLWSAGLGGDPGPLLAFATGPGWSARLAALLLGRAEPAALWAETTHTTVEAEWRARACQVEGYAGLLAEREGRREEAIRRYQACVATGVWHFLTHLWARERLRDLGQVGTAG